MSDLLANFIANLGADVVLGIVLFFIITRPRERKARKERISQALSLLKSELELNEARARENLEKLDKHSASDAQLPLRHTRGAWNALKESGLLLEVDDLKLVYYLFRVNEITYATNVSLRRSNFAAMGGRGDPVKMREQATFDSKRLLEALPPALMELGQLDLPIVTGYEFLETDSLLNEEDD